MASNDRLRRERRLESAQGYLLLGMPDHALGELDRIDDPEQCPLDAYQLRAEALREKNDFRAALKAYRRALLEDPCSVEILLAMAWCYKRTGQLPRAIGATQRAYRLCPKEPLILYNLSCYFSLAGDKENALSWLGRALRMEGSLRDLIPDEKDFDPLRHDPDFQFIVSASRNP